MSQFHINPDRNKVVRENGENNTHLSTRRVNVKQTRMLWNSGKNCSSGCDNRGS
jgi:hypothetical protein